jgi:hypothetical protein
MKKINALILCFICLSSCIFKTPEIKKTHHENCCITEGLFKGKWEDYYECGLFCIEKECYSQAVEYLNQALSIKTVDKRMIRTYGVHMIDYFPHREKGMALFFMNQYQHALKELCLSIQQEPSAKAFYYRDEILKILRKDEITKPEIIVRILSNYIESDKVFWTKEMSVKVSIIALDKNYVCGISINDQQYEMAPSKQKVQLSRTIQFEQGKQKLEVCANNILGGKNKKSIHLFIDRSGPLITLNQIDSRNEIKGHIFDDTGEITILVNNQLFLVQREIRQSFIIPPHILNNKNTIQAVDKLGNTSTVEIDKDILSQRFYPLTAQKKPDFMTDVGYGLFMLNDAIKVKIKGISKESQNIAYKNIISFEGEISAKNNIEALTVNNQSLFQTPGKKITFNIPIRLNEGNNAIHLSTKEKKCKSVHLTLEVFKKNASVYSIENRFAVKVKSFGGLYWHYQETEQAVHFKNIFTRIMRQKKRFRILTNNDKEIFSDALLYGELRQRNQGLEILVRLTNSQTREVMKVAVIKDIYIPSIKNKSWKALAEKIVANIHEEFPLDSGIINEFNEHDVNIEFKNKFFIKKNWPLIIFREIEPDSILGSETEITGYGKIIESLENKYKAIVDPIPEKYTGLFAITM